MTVCPKFGFEINDTLRQSYCRNCEGCSLVIKPRFELGKVDIFDLACRLKEKADGQKEKEL